MGIFPSILSPPPRKKIVLIFLVFKMEYFSYFIFLKNFPAFKISCLMQMVNQNRCVVFNFSVSLENLELQISQVKLLTIILKLADFSLCS